MARGKKTGGRQAGTRNKTTADVKAVAATYTTTAIEMLAEIMQDATAPHSARVSAANSLLDRACGKPQTFAENSISVESGESFPTQIELVAFESNYLKRLQESVLSEGANNG